MTMRTTITDIRRWLKQAPENATHMLVVCDTFSYEDYPKFVLKGEDAREVGEQHNGPNMTRLMEVYNLSMDLEPQIASVRAFNY